MHTVRMRTLEQGVATKHCTAGAAGIQLTDWDMVNENQALELVVPELD